MVTDLLFYGPGGVAEFHTTDHATIQLLGSHNNWRGDWTHIIPGDFGGGGLTDLLFYQASTGVGEFYSVDGVGGLSLLRGYTGWRNSWTHIIPGNFGGDGRTDLLFYDASDGTGEFYVARGPGDIVQLSVHSYWRNSWTQIVPGSFGGSGFTDLLFYDAGAGEGEFYAVDQGQMSMIRSHSGWRNTWTQIVPGNFGGSGATDLLFYDANDGIGDFYSTEDGQMSRLRTHTGWRQGWTKIVAGDFGGTSADDLLFYEPASGTGEFYEIKDGGVEMLRTSSDWRHTWTHLVPGVFAPRRAVRIHVKVIYAPDDPDDSIELQIMNARATFVRAGLRVIVGSTQFLDAAHSPGGVYAGPGPDIDIGDCSDQYGDDVSGEMWELFKKYDDDVGPNDVAIYFARNLYEPASGCARHPNDSPGAVVANMHHTYTLPHEIGHVLGLDHTDDSDHLMYEYGKHTKRPPTFDGGEIAKMIQSPYTIDL